MKRDLADNLARLMDRENLNQSELSTRCGIPAPTIGRILNRKIIAPGIDTAAVLADYFGITIDQLVGRSAIPGIDAIEDAKFCIPYPQTLGATSFLRDFSALDQRQTLDSEILSALGSILRLTSTRRPDQSE